MSLHPISSCSVRRSGIPARPAPRNARPWARPWAFARLAARRARHAAPLLLLAACADSGPLGGEDAAAPTDPIALCADPADSRASSLTAADIADFSVTACRSDRSGDGSSWIDAPSAPWFFNTRVYDITRVSGKSENATTYNSQWTYDQVQYWPSSSNQAIRFFALAPYAAVATSTFSITDDDSDGHASLTVSYRVPTKVADQQDLLYSYAPNTPINYAYDNSGDGIDTPDPVGLKFNHALSRISFKVQMGSGVDAAYTAMIKSVKLYAFFEGKLTISTAADTYTPSWDSDRSQFKGLDVIANPSVLTPGDGMKAANGSIADSGTATFNIATANRTANAQTGALEAVAAPNGQSIYLSKATIEADGTETPTDFLFVMPQQPPTGLDLTKPSQMRMPVLSVEYRLDNGQSGDDWLYTDKTTSFSLTDITLSQQTPSTSYDKLSQDDPSNWPWIFKSGQAYTILITINTNDITLNIYPTNWIDGNAGYHDYYFE